MENYEKIESEYLPNDMEDDDKMYHIKEVINTSLNSIQRKIWILYSEIGSYAGLSRELGICPTTAKKYLKHIRKLIYDNL